MTTETPGSSRPAYEADEPVLYSATDDVARITLNRPKFSNSQNLQMTYALDEAFMRAAADDGVRVVILDGAGKHFCAGHDIGSPGRDVDVGGWDRRSLWPDHTGKVGAEPAFVREQEIYLGMCRRWRALPKPTIALVQGACIAGGLMLAWVCDLIVASEDAFFADPVLQMGVPGVEYFAHAFEMHPRVAREFLFLGERMPAQRAWQLGMVNRLVPRERLKDEGKAIAERLKAIPSFGLMLAKQALNLTEDLQGKRSSMEATFFAHHLAHAHNALTSGSSIAGMDAKSMAAHNRPAADDQS